MAARFYCVISSACSILPAGLVGKSATIGSGCRLVALTPYLPGGLAQHYVPFPAVLFAGEGLGQQVLLQCFPLLQQALALGGREAARQGIVGRCFKGEALAPLLVDMGQEEGLGPVILLARQAGAGRQQGKEQQQGGGQQTHGRLR